VGVFNFHYASPPTAVPLNYHLHKVIAFDETTDGSNAPARRREAWAFLLSGGSVYSNLDWSYSVDDPTGTGKVAKGKKINGQAVRQQLNYLRAFMEKLDVVSMKPADSTLFTGISSGMHLYALADPGKSYALYLSGVTTPQPVALTANLPRGKYLIEWYNPRTGAVEATQQIKAKAKPSRIVSPVFEDDLALRITLPGQK
jgi:hypothetical protein